MDDSWVSLVDRIAGLPYGHLLAWTDVDVHVSMDAPRSPWVSVYVPGLCETLDWAWAWTIITPWDEAAEQAWPACKAVTIAAEPDLLVHFVLDPHTGWMLEDSPTVSVPYGQDLTEGQAYHLNLLARACNGTVTAVPAWSVPRLEELLAAWCADLAGRPDLRFEFDPNMPSPTPAHLVFDAAGPGMEQYEIAEGVYVTGKVMDTLLALPSGQAGQLTQGLLEAIAQARPPRASRRSR